MEAPPPFYHCVLSTLQNISALQVALDILKEPAIRLAEALALPLLLSGWVLQQQALLGMAMTPERFLGHLRYFE